MNPLVAGEALLEGMDDGPGSYRLQPSWWYSMADGGDTAAPQVQVKSMLDFTVDESGFEKMCWDDGRKRKS